MTTCASHLPPLVLRLPTLIFTRRDSTIRTKCLPCQSAEGGTSTAIRGNWQYLHSGQECWHQFPPQWLWGRLLRDQTGPEVTVLCWSWPEVCPGHGSGDPTFLLRLHALSTQSWLKSVSCEICPLLALLLLTKAMIECQSCISIWWIIENAFSTMPLILFLLFHRIMDPWCGARITSSAPR